MEDLDPKSAKSYHTRLFSANSMTALQTTPEPTPESNKHSTKQPTCACCYCQRAFSHDTSSAFSKDTKDASKMGTSTTYAMPKRILTRFHDPRMPLGLPFVAFLMLIRITQLFLALAACVVYGTPLAATSQRHFYIDPRWVYVVVIAGISAFYAAFCLIAPFLRPWGFYVVDLLLGLGWMVVFGIFGKLYIPEDAEGDRGIQRMKDLVWVDMCSMFLWFFTAVWGLWFLGVADRIKRARTSASSEESTSPVSED
jgi:hypothetical protein